MLKLDINISDLTSVFIAWLPLLVATSPHHLQWVDLPVTAVLRLANPRGGCHDTVDAAQNPSLSISSQQSSILLAVPLSISFPPLLLFTSPPHPTSLALYFSSSCSRSSDGHTPGPCSSTLQQRDVYKQQQQQADW